MYLHCFSATFKIWLFNFLFLKLHLCSPCLNWNMPFSSVLTSVLVVKSLTLVENINDNSSEGMTKIWKEWQKSGRNDSNMEGMTIMRKEWHKVFFWKKKMFFAWMLPQIVLLPPLGHKEAIGTLGYHIASKLED